MVKECRGISYFMMNVFCNSEAICWLAEITVALDVLVTVISASRSLLFGAPSYVTAVP